MGSGTAATVLALWIGGAHVIPRYLSYLLVPLFMLVASGMGEVLGRLRSRPTIAGTLASALLVGVVFVSFLGVVAGVLRYPREAYMDTARTVERVTPNAAPVLAYLRNPDGLAFYLRRPFTALGRDDVSDAVCVNGTPVVYVHQPFGVDEIDLPCLERPGVRHYAHRQYARGDVIDVWLVPPIDASRQRRDRARHQLARHPAVRGLS
jgi:hypothetical protein